MSTECANLGTRDKYFVDTNFRELPKSHEYSKNLSHAKISTSMYGTVQYEDCSLLYLLISAS